MENLNYLILINLFMISSSILFLSLSYNLIRTIKLRRDEIRLKELEINISSDIEDDTFTILDRIIEECFTEYTVLNIEYRDDITYIDAELEKIITQDVSHKVIDRISPALISKISLIYNIDNLDELLAERVYLFTMNYAITKNNVKEG